MQRAFDLFESTSHLSATGNAFPIDAASFIDLGRGVRARYGRVSIRNISLNPANPRTHSKKQIRKIARSMEVAGPLAPVIIDENYMVWAGEARGVPRSALQRACPQHRRSGTAQA